MGIFVQIFGGRIKRFSARVRLGRSRLAKVVDFDANRKRVWVFLLVRHSNLGPILHRFGDIAGFVLMTHPYSTLIWGYSCWTRPPLLGPACA